jgi:hypothetical protein
MTQANDIPVDVFLFEIARFMTLCQIAKLAMTNKRYRDAMKKITHSNRIDTVLFGTVDTKIAQRMEYHGLTYHDLLHSSFNPSFMDDMIALLQLPVVCTLYKVKQMFNYTRRTRAYIRESRFCNNWVPIEYINIHNKIFAINEHSDITKDFKIFQFLLHLTDMYTQDLSLYVLYASLVKQMMRYFEEMSLKEFEGVCSDDIDQKFLNKKVRANQEAIYRDVLDYFHTIGISDLNVNLFNYYSIILTSFVTDKITFFIAHNDALRFKQIGIDEKMTIRPLYSLTEAGLQSHTIHTISTLLDMVIYEHTIDARTYMIGMLFSYINAVISDGHLDSRSTKLISESKSKATEVLGYLEKIIDKSCFNQHFAIASGILTQTQGLQT